MNEKQEQIFAVIYIGAHVPYKEAFRKEVASRDEAIKLLRDNGLSGHIEYVTDCVVMFAETYNYAEELKKDNEFLRNQLAVEQKELRRVKFEDCLKMAHDKDFADLVQENNYLKEKIRSHEASNLGVSGDYMEIVERLRKTEEASINLLDNKIELKKCIHILEQEVKTLSLALRQERRKADVLSARMKDIHERSM